MKNSVLPNLKVALFSLKMFLFLDFIFQIAHLRADNAGYYHNASLILGLAAISKASGVMIKSFNTSEPGYGKVRLLSFHLTLLKMNILHRMFVTGRLLY